MSSGRSQNAAERAAGQAPAARRSRGRAAGKALFRGAILEAAEAVFDERGLHAARIQDIAERAGVAVGTVYNHFEQKEDLVRALLVRHLPAAAARLAPAADDPADWTGAFRARMARLHAYVAEHRHFFGVACELGLLVPGGPRIDGDPASEPPVAAAANPALLVEAMIGEGIAAGVIAGDPVRLTRFLFGATRALVEGVLATGSEQLREEAALAVDLFLRAVAVAAPRAAESAQ